MKYLNSAFSKPSSHFESGKLETGVKPDGYLKSNENSIKIFFSCPALTYSKRIFLPASVTRDDKDQASSTSIVSCNMTKPVIPSSKSLLAEETSSKETGIYFNHYLTVII